MAVKVLAGLRDWRYDPYSGIWMTFMMTTGFTTSIVEFGPYDMQVAEPTLNTTIKDDIKQWTIDHWSLTYGIGDVVQLLQKISFI